MRPQLSRVLVVGLAIFAVVTGQATAASPYDAVSTQRTVSTEYLMTLPFAVGR